MVKRTDVDDDAYYVEESLEEDDVVLDHHVQNVGFPSNVPYETCSNLSHPSSNSIVMPSQTYFDKDLEVSDIILSTMNLKKRLSSKKQYKVKCMHC